MKSPRHRWNCVAMPLGLGHQPDGLSMTVTPDKIALELKKVVTGKGRNKAIERALDLFRTDSTRILYESVLLATCDIDLAAKIFKERPDHMKMYADCFFDISVFESTGDKVMYLDRYAQLHPDAAQMMRNAMQTSAEEFLFLSDKSNTRKVDAKTAIETGLHLYYSMMTTFIQPKMEELIQRPDMDPSQAQLLEQLFSKANTCSREVRAYSELLLKYELDKNADNFLEEFRLALTNKPPKEMLAGKPGKGDPEIH